MRTWFLDKSQGRTNHFIEEPDGSVTIDTVENVAPILEANKRQLNDFGKLMPGKMGILHHTARIPPTLLERWIQETKGEVLKDGRLFAKYLNDPDNKYFQVAPTTL